MKATGIVRRLDDLGRLVIPKEIRKQYRLKEGDSIEFFIENEHIIIQKFDVLSHQMEEINLMIETLQQMYQNQVLFMQDEYLDRKNLQITPLFMKMCLVHRPQAFENKVVFVEDSNRYNGVIQPITSYGEYFGAFVMLFDKKEIKEEELKPLEAFAQLLTRQQQE